MSRGAFKQPPSKTPRRHSDPFPLLPAEKRRREAISAATCLTEALVDHLNVGYERSHPHQLPAPRVGAGKTEGSRS